MGVRMRVNRSHTGNRRSHHGLSEPRLSRCACGAEHLRHRACRECGMYRGKQVIDVVARAEREARRAKRRNQELQDTDETPANQSDEQQPDTQEMPEADENK